ILSKKDLSTSEKEPSQANTRSCNVSATLLGKYTSSGECFALLPLASKNFSFFNVAISDASNSCSTTHETNRFTRQSSCNHRNERQKNKEVKGFIPLPIARTRAEHRECLGHPAL